MIKLSMENKSPIHMICVSEGLSQCAWYCFMKVSSCKTSDEESAIEVFRKLKDTNER
jgi:hypothetical protein